jgi:hypothetical protein
MIIPRSLRLAYAAAVTVLLASATLMPPAGVRAGSARSASSHVNMATTDARFGVDEAYQQANRADALGALEPHPLHLGLHSA